MIVVMVLVVGSGDGGGGYFGDSRVVEMVVVVE